MQKKINALSTFMFGYSSKSQVIVEHSYLGPLCLQLTNPSSVADVKREIMDRTGLSVKNQHIYCSGKKVCDEGNTFRENMTF